MNKTTLNSQKEKHSMLSLRRATTRGQGAPVGVPYFYPRSPCGERREYLLVVIVGYHNFYPRSPCGERRATLNIEAFALYISIHALLAESDKAL